MSALLLYGAGASVRCNDDVTPQSAAKEPLTCALTRGSEPAGCKGPITMNCFRCPSGALVQILADGQWSTTPPSEDCLNTSDADVAAWLAECEPAGAAEFSWEEFVSQLPLKEAGPDWEPWDWWLAFQKIRAVAFLRGVKEGRKCMTAACVEEPLGGKLKYCALPGEAAPRDGGGQGVGGSCAGGSDAGADVSLEGSGGSTGGAAGVAGSVGGGGMSGSTGTPCDPKFCPNNGFGSPCCVTANGPCGVDYGTGCVQTPTDAGAGGSSPGGAGGLGGSGGISTGAGGSAGIGAQSGTGGGDAISDVEGGAAVDASLE